MLVVADEEPGRVLLTGASGWIASHILDQLLELGHPVTMTVRSESKAQSIYSTLPPFHLPLVDHVILPDIAAPSAFDHAVRRHPFTAVIHTAMPYKLSCIDPITDFIDPGVKGTVGVLKAVKEGAPMVRRVVVTSSTAAVLSIREHQKKKFHYTEESRSPLELADADENPHYAYSVAKTYSERAAWKFMQEENPTFSLTTIHPTYVFGPIQRFLSTPSEINTSNLRIYNYALGNEFKASRAIITFVDVRDVAMVHVRALRIPVTAGQRLVLIADYFTDGQIVEAIKERVPKIKEQVTKVGDEMYKVPDWAYTWNISKTKEMLKMEFIGLDKSVGDTVESMIERFPSILQDVA